ncbi:membrane protein [Mycobacterium phage Delylah]|nr:membrane protein [Mycobacterium phage Delylah]
MEMGLFWMCFGVGLAFFLVLSGGGVQSWLRSRAAMNRARAIKDLRDAGYSVPDDTEFNFPL